MLQKQLKQFISREHFYEQLDPKGPTFEYLQSHAGKGFLLLVLVARLVAHVSADHCLDFIRQSIMCRLDYSLYTLYWGERRQDIPTHRIPGVQKCVNWDNLHDWMLERAVSIDMLMGP